MQYNYFPGRFRFRDPVLRDEDIRSAVFDVVKIICIEAEISYKESTAGILAIYPENSVDLEKFKPIVPYLMKLEPKIRFYTPKKKTEILQNICIIKEQIEEILGKIVD